MALTVLCGTLVDGTGAAPQKDVALKVEGDRIVAIDPIATSRTEGDVLDLRHAAVVPGLIDCHEHLGIDIGDEEAQCAEPLEYIAVKATVTAKKVIEGGITTIRNVGEKALIGYQLKRAISEGLIPGPRMLTAGRNIVRTGGHGWFLGVEADGADALRGAVREEIKRGADLIKIMVSGGVSTKGSDVLAPEFTDDDVRAIIDEAHKRGRKVAAHGHGGPGVRSAVLAGVDSIEQGAFLTMDYVRLMAEHGTYLVVTAAVFFEILAGDHIPEFQKDKLRSVRDNFLEMLAGTRGSGLKIAIGTDEIHGQLYREMQILEQVGYSREEAFLAGTRGSADLCGISSTLGSLEPGKIADLVAVEGNPLDDLSVLSRPLVVMQNGKVSVDHRAAVREPVLA